MNADNFQLCAIKSAQAYYHYLEENGRGVVSIAVQSIEPAPPYFYLYLRTKLSNAVDLDSLEYEFCGKRHSSFEIKALRYSRSDSVLTVRPSDVLFADFAALSPKKLFIVSDLKFLVRRVEKWYLNFGQSIRPVLNVPAVSPVFCANSDTLSDEQRASVSGALHHPFTYIWGAPGAGKTSCVLANCVLSYLCASEPQSVLLLAPTNNALEQMLLGILPFLTEQNIPLNHVLRLGTPSAQFYRQYSDVCESYGLEDKLQLKRETIQTLERCLNFRCYSDKFLLAVSDIPPLIEESSQLRSICEQLQSALEAMRRDSAAERADLVLQQDKIDRSLQEIALRKKRIEHSLSFRIKKALFPSSYQNSVFLLKEDESQLHRDIEKTNSLKAKLSALENQSLQTSAELDRANCKISKNEEKIMALCGFWDAFQGSVSKLITSPSRDCSGAFQMLCNSFRAQLEKKSVCYLEFSDYTTEELQNKLESENQIFAELSSQKAESRAADVRVVAATIDRFLASFSPNIFESFHPSHIFMDEAGYVSLIKAMPIFSLGVPVTFTGDHMQLPPVCEMNDQNFRKDGFHEVFLWAQSALYAEDVFSADGTADLLEDYLNVQPPKFDMMKKYDLTATFRFGSSLANLLASYIYSSNFHSESSSGTSICYLNAPKNPGKKKRTSQSEADAIAGYLSHAQISDYAILTPYRNQVELLSSALPETAKDGRILSIHASQGREWDVLFLSVVDAEDKWFSDTVRPETRGKMVINTAVSRARKKLILVCDSAYWNRHPEQLIGRLVRAGTPLS